MIEWKTMGMTFVIIDKPHDQSVEGLCHSHSYFKIENPIKIVEIE